MGQFGFSRFQLAHDGVPSLLTEDDPPLFGARTEPFRGIMLCRNQDVIQARNQDRIPNTSHADRAIADLSRTLQLHIVSSIRNPAAARDFNLPWVELLKPRSTRFTSPKTTVPTADWLRTELIPGCRVANCAQSRPFNGSWRTVVADTCSLTVEVAVCTEGAAPVTSTC